MVNAGTVVQIIMLSLHFPLLSLYCQNLELLAKTKINNQNMTNGTTNTIKKKRKNTRNCIAKKIKKYSPKKLRAYVADIIPSTTRQTTIKQRSIKNGL